MLEFQVLSVWKSALKIRVSVVRFRPWPPTSQHRSSITLYGVLLCAVSVGPDCDHPVIIVPRPWEAC